MFHGHAAYFHVTARPCWTILSYHAKGKNLISYVIMYLLIIVNNVFVYLRNMQKIVTFLELDQIGLILFIRFLLSIDSNGHPYSGAPI